jgi:hypothetical protein
MPYYLHVYKSARAEEFIAVPYVESELDGTTLAAAIIGGRGLTLSDDSIARHLKSTLGPRRLWQDVIIHR